MKTILLTKASSYKTIVICKYIKKTYKDFLLFCTDNKVLVEKYHSKYIDRVIIVDEGVDGLKQIIKNNKIDIFIPTQSSEMGYLLKNKKYFTPLLDYWSDFNDFDDLNDKDKLSDLCRELNIPHPLKYASLKDSLPPFVMKPKISAGSKGVKYIRNLSAKKRIQKNQKINLDTYIFQEEIKGFGIGYSVFSIDGKILASHGHKRLIEFPISGGSSVLRESYNNKQAIHYAKKIIKYKKWSGFAMFEFKEVKNGNVILIEVNPRVWGSINQGLMNGTNYFSYLLGDTQIENKIKKKYTYLSPLVYLAILNQVIRLKILYLIRFIKTFLKSQADVGFIDDYKGFISLIVKRLK